MSPWSPPKFSVRKVEHSERGTVWNCFHCGTAIELYEKAIEVIVEFSHQEPQNNEIRHYHHECFDWGLE